MTANIPIRRTFDRVPAGIVKAARRFQASILADVGGRRGTLGGRIVVPRETAAEIVGAAQAKLDSEAERMKAIGRGELVQAWVAESLSAVGVLKKDDVL